jgi:prepilin-type N-terminal cleavage/methylation domain-containing protein
MIPQPTQPKTTRRPRAFTLIELLVVIVVMVILMAITMPAIKSLTRNNNQKQAVNQITAMLANARSNAIATGRQTGVVFYEETAANVSPANPNQTAAQMITEDPNQAQYASQLGTSSNTILIQAAGR